MKKLLSIAIALLLLTAFVPSVQATEVQSAGLDYMNLGPFYSAESNNHGAAWDDPHEHGITAEKHGNAWLFTHTNGGCGRYWPKIDTFADDPVVIPASDYDKYALYYDFTVSEEASIVLRLTPWNGMFYGNHRYDYFSLTSYILNDVNSTSDLPPGVYKGSVPLKTFIDFYGNPNVTFSVAGARIFVVGYVGATVEIRDLKIGAVADVSSASSWAREGILSALYKGFVPDNIQNDYKANITRLDFCRMAVKYIEYATGKSINAVMAERGVSRDPNAFTDTQDPDILAAYALGVTNGTGQGKFTPCGDITREQAATMLLNVNRALGYYTENAPAANFVDLDEVRSWAKNGVNYCTALGIMEGTGFNAFSPAMIYSREQSILTFNRMDIRTVTIGGETYSTSTDFIWTYDYIDDYVMQLSYMKNLSFLGANVREPANLEPLALLPKLTQMRVMIFGSKDLSVFAKFNNLRYLSIENSNYSNTAAIDVSPLALMPNLYSLTIDGYSFNDLNVLKNAQNLSSLTLYNSKLVDLQPVSQLTALSGLNIYYSNITDLTPLKDFKSLQSLSIQYSPLSDISILPYLTDLTSIDLSNNNIVDISPLKDCAYLNNISLQSNNITDITPLEKILPGVGSLSLWGNNIDDVSVLSHLSKECDFLDLGHNNISDIGALAHLTNLWWLYLNNNQIEDVSPLKDMVNLGYLSLDKNQISDLSPFANYQSYTILSLMNNPITDWSPVAHIYEVYGRP